MIITEMGSVNFRAEFPDKNGGLKNGSSGQVLIPRELDSVFAVPQKATFNLQDSKPPFTERKPTPCVSG